jgi:hypothetical protein
MGTRGLIGVEVDGEKKCSYNHSDSYPTGLGKEFVEQCSDFITRHGLDNAKRMSRNIRMVNNDDIPTVQDIKGFKEFNNSSVGNSEGIMWYNLLRGMQGDIAIILECGTMLNATSFLEDSLFCEWAYILNLDDESIDVYRGFNKITNGEYGPCTLLTSYDLHNEVLNHPKKVVEALYVLDLG